MDIYFKEEYGKLYEKHENGKLMIYEYSDEIGKIKHMFIMRKIPSESDEEYYDIITPYGYGGPLIIDSTSRNKNDELISNFENNFEEFCKNNKIVSEFVRFHPLIENHLDFQNMYEIEYTRKTLGTNLKDYEDPFMSEFSKSCRKTIRRSLREGLTYEIQQSPDNIDHFLEIYKSTMDRNSASEYYYFDENYFSSILENLKKHLILVNVVFNEKIIASGLYFIYEDTIHLHLSGTISEYLHLSPAYILRYAVTQWGKQNGYKMIHHGGGKTNSENDPLFEFKKRFAQNTEFEFYIGKKIWNKQKYEELSKNKMNIDFFPKYRG